MRFELEVLDQDVADAPRHRAVDLEPDGQAEVAAPHHLRHRGEEVVGLVLFDLEVAVAGDAERIGVDDLETGEQPVEVGGDHLLDPDQRGRARRRRPRHRRRARAVGGGVVLHQQQAREVRRHLESSELLAGVAVAHHHRQVDAAIGDVRERMAGVEGERREDGEQLGLETAAQRGLLRVVELAVADDADAALGQAGQEVARPAIVGSLQHRQQALVDGLELLDRRHAVRRRLDHAGLALLEQPRHPDHEELVEVAVEDGEEVHPLEQRIGGVERLLEHPFVEAEPGELAVDVEPGILEVDLPLLLDCVGSSRNHFLRHPMTLAERRRRFAPAANRVVTCAASSSPVALPRSSAGVTSA